MTHIAFIGLGTMGLPMAHNLIRGGHTVTGFDLDADAVARRIAMVDAPVGRSSQHAVDGKLLIMVGGEVANLERARPVLALLGDTIVDCGDPGMGARMKIINNYMSIALGALTAETLTLAEAIGLDRDLAIDVMSGTAAGQGHMRTSLPNKAFKGDLSPGFMVDLAHKDIGLALDLAAAQSVPVLLGAAAREMYSIARGQNRGCQGWSAIYTMIREMAGLAS